MVPNHLRTEACLHAHRAADGGGEEQVANALDALERAVALGWTDFVMLRQSSHLECVRDHERFRKLLETD
ncbi:MAG: TPR end-of-group domain-containing protein [Planctomycetota bacterium]|jgi:hypothetical protein